MRLCLYVCECVYVQLNFFGDGHLARALVGRLIELWNDERVSERQSEVAILIEW